VKLGMAHHVARVAVLAHEGLRVARRSRLLEPRDLEYRRHGIRGVVLVLRRYLWAERACR
jgi:hypothetical protein